MEKYNSLRWDRIEELNVDINYIKRCIKEMYGYEIRENNISNLRINLKQYKEINEVNLLNFVEEYCYKKASIFDIRKYKRNNGMPIVQDLTTMLYAYFKEKNAIKLSDGEYYNGELDEQFIVTYYKKREEYVIIKLSRVNSVTYNEPDEEGGVTEENKKIYDCCKFYIDLKRNKVIMFYNDIKISDMNYGKEVTLKKNVFRSLFDGVSNKNMIRYYISDSLENYFKEYMDEIRNNNVKKLISIIEATSQNGEVEERNLIRSVNKDCKHSEKRLEAIEHDVENEGLIISEIETRVNGNTIDIKGTGDITCVDTFLYKEVIEDVCREFFGGYKIFE